MFSWTGRERALLILAITLEGLGHDQTRALVVGKERGPFPICLGHAVRVGVLCTSHPPMFRTGRNESRTLMKISYIKSRLAKYWVSDRNLTLPFHMSTKFQMRDDGATINFEGSFIFCVCF